MIFKFVFKKHGDNVYVRSWVGPAVGQLAFAGKIAYANAEWNDFVKIMNRGKIPGSQIIWEEQVISAPAK